MCDLKKSVIIGMSGGVDSTVGAYLLKQQGYKVTGVTLKMLREQNGFAQIEADAKKAADMLGIEHITLDFTKSFEDIVVADFINEYKAGRTPNPCIVCNRFLKFEKLLEAADKLGADYIATGHYAKIDFNAETGRYFVRKSVYDRKDQSYVLYRLTQEQLKRTVMPLFKYSKDEIRAIAEKIGLEAANKPDSQDICFIPDGDYIGFLKSRSCTSPQGDFVDAGGNKIGTHLGIMHYTIGQRKGLGMTFGKPMFVSRINAENNTVELCEAGGQYKNTVFAENVNFQPFERLDVPQTFMCKLRYSAKPQEALVTPIGEGRVKIEFEDCKSAAAPGQAAVFYSGDMLVGGGIIYDMY